MPRLSDIIEARHQELQDELQAVRTALLEPALGEAESFKDEPDHDDPLNATRLERIYKLLTEVEARIKRVQERLSDPIDVE